MGGGKKKSLRTGTVRRRSKCKGSKGKFKDKKRPFTILNGEKVYIENIEGYIIKWCMNVYTTKIQKLWRGYKARKEQEQEEIFCGEGDTNVWTPKGCGCVLNIDDANYMDDGRGTAYYCDDCYREED